MRFAGRKAALLVWPLSAALTIPFTPAASAQFNSATLGPGSGTSYLNPNDLPKRTPRQTTHQNLPGLPAGVSVDRVEWITDRWANLYINSVAMPGEPVKVQLLLARDWHAQPDRKFPTVWALDGLRARDDESGWTLLTNIASFYADKNVNVVLPVGGESSFYTDWEKPDNGKNYKWESFLIRELPAVLREGWRSSDKRAIVGLSMGGTAAINLAERFPEMWNFAGSFSGYLDTTSFGMPQAIDFATHDGNGYDAQKMWGPYGSQNWIDHDPKLGISALKNMTVYVSAGNGNTGKWDKPGILPGIPENLAGFGLEVISRLTTETFVRYAHQAGVRPIVAFRNSGTHSWPYWQFEMTQAWPAIADSLGLAPADRGANCSAEGAIGERTVQFPDLGACLSPEYNAKAGGRIQDFRGGRAYWHPDTGAHFLWGRIGARYVEMNGPDSWLGYPTSEEHVIAGGRGRFVSFQHGNIYWTHETGAFAVSRVVLDKWGQIGYENGPLGFPTSMEQLVGPHGIQMFDNGVIVRKADNTAEYVQGMIANKYIRLGGINSPLGLPVSGEIDIPGGKFSRFEHGNIYWSPSTGAHVIYYGRIFDAWGSQQWEQGRFGFPVSDHIRSGNGSDEIRFQGGVIRDNNGAIEFGS